MEPTSSLVFILNEKTAEVKTGTPVKKDKKDKTVKKDKKDKACNKDKLKVKADLFGADIDASAVRSSRNVNVLFHVRPGCLCISRCHAYLCEAEQIHIFDVSVVSAEVVSQERLRRVVPCEGGGLRRSADCVEGWPSGAAHLR